MLDDRSYMRQGSLRGRWPITYWLIAINLGVFALQEIGWFYFGISARALALSADGLRHGYVWQLITFQFLHAGFGHILGNVIGLFFLGRMVEERLGSRGLLKVYLLSGVAGGLLQSVLSALWPEHFRSVVGASAGVCGLLAAAAALDPNQPILAYLVLPIRIKYLLMFTAVVSIFYVFVPVRGEQGGVAHAAHLGGIIGGLAYMRWGAAWEDFFRVRRIRRPRLRPRELIRVRSSNAASWQRTRDTEDLPPEEFISREVDPILDKISAHGIQSLTPRERQILERARSKMERR
jgi:membrane associated rhomboid family serine protease